MSRTASDRSTVAIVIPALNEERSISACLDAVLAQTWTDLDVIVADGGSTDATRAIVDEYGGRDGRVRIVDNPRRTQPAALNSAVAHTDADWIVRIDAHSTVPPTYVASVMTHLSTGNWGGVGGRKDGVAHSAQGRAVAAALGSPFGVGNSVYHHGTEVQTVDHIPFGAYPMAVVRELGGWDENTPTNEDYEFDYRVRQSGKELLFDPRLVIFWETRETVKAFFQQYRRYGRAKYLTLRKHPESAAIRHLIPTGLVATLVAASVIACVRPRWAAAIVAPYAGVIAAATATVAPTLDSAESCRWLPLAFMAMHLGHGIGMWEALLVGARPEGGRRRG